MEFSNRENHKSPLQAGINRATRSVLVFLAANVAICPLSALAVAPTANVDDRVTVQGVDLTINALANDTDADGDSLQISNISSPTFGNITINTDNSIRYTPNDDFEGVETLTYTVQDSSGETTTGEINIVVNSALLEQEALTVNNRGVGSAIDRFCLRIQAESPSLTSKQQLLAQRCRALYNLLSTGDTAAVRRALSQIAGEEVSAQFDTSNEFAKSHLKLISDRLMELRSSKGGRPVSISFNDQLIEPFQLFGYEASGGNAGNSAGYDDPALDPFSKMSLFVNGSFGQMGKDDTVNEHGFESEAYHLTVGADYRFRPNLIGGVAIGYQDETVDFTDNGGGLETEALSLTFYGSYFRDNWTLDAVLGFGDIDYYNVRNTVYNDVGLVQNSSISDTGSDQTIFNLTLSYDLHKQNRYGEALLSPFINLEYINTDVDAYTELSSGAWDIRYDGQSYETVMLSVGLFTSQPISMSWGVLTPQARFTFYNGFDDSANSVTGYFVNDINQNALTFESNEVDTQYLQMGLGGSMTLTGGFSLFADYEKILQLEYTDIDRFAYGVRWEMKW